MPTGALFNEITGFVDWGPKTGPLSKEEFDPVDIGFVAGELLARSKISGGPKIEGGSKVAPASYQGR